MYPNIEPSEFDKAHAKEIRQITDTWVNDDGRGLTAALAQEHRTSQQNFTRIMVAWIEYLANLEHGEYDLRNEASVKLAKQLVATPKWQELKFLPYV